MPTLSLWRRLATRLWLVAYVCAWLMVALLGVVYALAPASVRRRHSNCVFHVWDIWWNSGGYIVLMWSHYTSFPHFVYTPDLKTFMEFTPSAKILRVFPPPLFHGSEQPWTKPDDSI